MRAIRRRFWRPCRRRASTSPRLRVRPTRRSGRTGTGGRPAGSGHRQGISQQRHAAGVGGSGSANVYLRTGSWTASLARQVGSTAGGIGQPAADLRGAGQGIVGRGELLERSFAHAYETGGMRRVFLRGRKNVLKRGLIHVGALNLSLVMRQLLGKGSSSQQNETTSATGR